MWLTRFITKNGITSSLVWRKCLYTAFMCPDVGVKLQGWQKTSRPALMSEKIGFHPLQNGSATGHIVHQWHCWIVTHYVKEDKKSCATAVRERELEKYGRNSPEDIKVSEEWGAEGASRQQSRDCPACMEQTMVAQLCPCSLWRISWQGRWMHLVWSWDLMESPQWSSTAAHGESRFSGKTLILQGAHAGAGCSLKDCTLWKAPGAVLEEL